MHAMACYQRSDLGNDLEKKRNMLTSFLLFFTRLSNHKTHSLGSEKFCHALDKSYG